MDVLGWAIKVSLFCSEIDVEHHLSQEPRVCQEDGSQSIVEKLASVKNSEANYSQEEAGRLEELLLSSRLVRKPQIDQG